MSFYDINPDTLPEGAVYYHNVLLVNIGIAPSEWEYDFENIWYLEEVTTSRPIAFVLYVDKELEEEWGIKFDITFVPHSVIEVCDNNLVSWYSTQDDDFNLDQSWSI